MTDPTLTCPRLPDRDKLTESVATPLIADTAGRGKNALEALLRETLPAT